MQRDSWGSRIGFIFAVAGSAVGLANIWRFPYVVGQYGGAAFILVYLICLFLIGFPVFMAEMIIGRKAQTSPSGAFQQLGKSRAWAWAGKMTIITGFIVSSFYSAVAGWILGYLIEALKGNVVGFSQAQEAVARYENLLANPWWGVSFHFLFLAACIGVLYSGVRNGIEKGNKIFMPLLFIALIALVVQGLSMPKALDGLRFLFQPDWSALTPGALLIALGQSFFTLSLGQGTMVTYGSYVNKKENLIENCFPAALMDTVVSLLASIAVFTIVFSANLKPDSGPGLIFHTLPWAFSQISGGYALAVLFFFLVTLAALTSEISALEPAIAYLIDEKGWKRHSAVLACGAGAFLLGVPSALSYSLLKNYSLFNMNFLDLISFIASSFLIPFGGFLAVILVGWIWGANKGINHLKEGAEDLFQKHKWLSFYFRFCFKYSAPILIIFVFLNSLGIF